MMAFFSNPLVASRNYTYKQYIQTADSNKRYSKPYQKWKKAVLERDHYKCCYCGRKNNLNVHHIKQYTDNIFLRTKTTNGIALCKECHRKQHPWMNKSLKAFGAKPKTILRKRVNVATQALGDPA